MQVYAVTCEKDRGRWWAMQAFRPQPRLLGFWLTKGVEQPRAHPSRHAHLYLFCLFSSLWKHSEEFHSDFFFGRELVNSWPLLPCCYAPAMCWFALWKLQIPVSTFRLKKNTTAGKFSSQEYIYRQKYRKKCSNVHSHVRPWAGNENYWLKAFRRHSQKQRWGQESHE